MDNTETIAKDVRGFWNVQSEFNVGDPGARLIRFHLGVDWNSEVHDKSKIIDILLGIDL